MIGGKDLAWLRRRAEQERRLADVANGMPARRAHQQLAELYDCEAGDLERSALHSLE